MIESVSSPGRREDESLLRDTNPGASPRIGGGDLAASLELCCRSGEGWIWRTFCGDLHEASLPVSCWVTSSTGFLVPLV